MPSLKKEFIPELVLVPEGFFLMGSNHGPDNEKLVHRVWVNGFLIGKFPVTNKEYRIFVKESGAPEPPFWSQEMFSHPDKPVVGISWYDGLAYCDWLRHLTGKKFRLPSEAQWERAARGGLEGKRYPWGDEPPWERPYPGYDLETGGPQRLGLNEPNDFGIYDMS
jgi:formylglycine-generating enzyme required for sulfatase activity